jgi:hypothetical protein
MHVFFLGTAESKRTADVAFEKMWNSFDPGKNSALPTIPSAKPLRSTLHK